MPIGPLFTGCAGSGLAPCRRSEPEVIAIEFKVADWRRALSQATRSAIARQIATAALGPEVNRTAALTISRNFDIEPTLKIRPGRLFFVQPTADLVLFGPYS